MVAVLGDGLHVYPTFYPTQDLLAAAPSIDGIILLCRTEGSVGSLLGWVMDKI
jgi:hypothetical protein